MKKKLLFIAPANSVHSKKWIEAFLKFDYKIYWISFYKKTIEIDSRITFFLFESNIILSFFKLKGLINKIKPDLVHYHYLGFQLFLIPFLQFEKLITSPWGSDIKFTSKNSLKGLFVRKIFNLSNSITVDANFMIDEVKKFEIKNPQKIIRINYGTDTSFFNFYLKKRGKIFKIISLRNLEEIYAIDNLIYAVKNLVSMGYNLEVDIYGSGSQENILKAIVDESKLNKYINFKGRYNYSNLPKILRRYDLYISTSTSDAGLSASTSEAMSSGTLVLSADNSENPYWMDNRCGFLYQTKSVSDLTSKIKEIISLEDDVIFNYKSNARKKIEDFNDYINEMNKMNKIYLKNLEH